MSSWWCHLRQLSSLQLHPWACKQIHSWSLHQSWLWPGVFWWMPWQCIQWGAKWVLVCHLHCPCSQKWDDMFECLLQLIKDHKSRWIGMSLRPGKGRMGMGQKHSHDIQGKVTCWCPSESLVVWVHWLHCLTYHRPRIEKHLADKSITSIGLFQDKGKSQEGSRRKSDY